LRAPDFEARDDVDPRFAAPRFAAPRFAPAFAPLPSPRRPRVPLALALERRAAVRGVAERRPYSARSGLSSPSISIDGSFGEVVWLVFLALGITSLLGWLREHGRDLAPHRPPRAPPTA
jgi:hypothetical protein